MRAAGSKGAFDRGIAIGVITFLAAGVCAADTITVNGTTYDDVYVRFSASRYYVQLPADGGVLSFPKTAVGPNDVAITEDAAVRQNLLDQWQANRAALDAQESAPGSELSGTSAPPLVKGGARPSGRMFQVTSPGWVGITPAYRRRHAPRIWS